MLLVEISWKYIVILCIYSMTYLVSEAKGSPDYAQKLPVCNTRKSISCELHPSYFHALLIALSLLSLTDLHCEMGISPGSLYLVYLVHIYHVS